MSISESAKQNLIVVSNRLPLSVKRAPDGSYQSSISSGGLVTSLSGLTKTTKFRWFGWPGLEVQKESEIEEVKRSLGEHDAYPIFLSDELAHDHYNGFSNQILWPSLHYQSGVIFKDGPWEAYRKVNELFADSVAEAANDGDLIWVHDYHLMLLPKLLRERLAKQGKKCPIGFSLHTPFPAADFWRALPVSKELLEGLLASNLVGFHTDEYKQNFIDSCGLVLGADTNIPNKIQYNGRLILTDKFIVGIDPQKFVDTKQESDVQNRIGQLKDRYKGIKVILGVDRLDYIKGLTQKLIGYETFLEQHPEWRGKVVLIQVAVPSREDVKEYKDLETEISTIVGKINGKYASPDSTPLIYLHRSIPFPELTALYSVADVCLLASTRDGMNLVSFEYVACQQENNGVLALSQFTGAASFMKDGALTFHPANPNEISEAVNTALTMPDDKRKANYQKLKDFIEYNTSGRWGETFVSTLSGCSAK
ncbi:alpha,alpha-trehalose-phosphate synthase subunit, putative [Paecilomyces variotii No. 5]|uniref:alpha,alpha-trehalose-phosphate synthase (UDP-forming) n=1 Tax=Byssochlamys spectabilis (strain No. 5 / NBRC 109023) TaxID=1356009 RepID=V5HTL9_BYSSN|nr:alpha,alpha-trehalose-phosphate synthase subunit, putative [Paecilomyces variotii No. 5]